MTVPARFAIGEHDFLLDGEPFRILSGAMHYFRVHPDHWADRIAKARQMGLNTIETYVAWNAHAPTEDSFDLTGPLDLGRFLDLVAAEGMYAIVRPGPYICAEWTNGGLPGWLLRRPGVAIRRNEPTFMAAIAGYLRHLAPVIVPRQLDRGGPVILVQIENEYGAYGDDKAYLQALVDLTRGIGVTVPLTTVDQPTDEMLAAGSLPRLHKTGSFGSRATQRLQTLRRHQPTGPLMCSEFWDGWFDDWGTPHHVTEVADAAEELRAILAAGASVNVYMFHGGTNFGLTNGANDKGTYEPITTSYDYDAPLDEAGNPTAKYWALREVIAAFAPVGDDAPAAAGPAPAFRVPVDRARSLWDVVDDLGRWRDHDEPPTADALGQDRGFTLYRTGVDVAGPATFEVAEVRDRAQVFLDRRRLGVLSREHHETSLELPAGAHGTLEVLVEDQGRVNYGPRLGEPKGLIGPVTIAGVPVRGWRAMPLDLADPEPVARALRDAPENATVHSGPAFARALFDLRDGEPADLFLHTGDWGKGVVWVNGFCLGRYWCRGPQRTLYVPGPALRPTGNELLVLELEAGLPADVAFVPAPDLGETT
jgi:beta-galactosidase